MNLYTLDSGKRRRGAHRPNTYFGYSRMQIPFLKAFLLFLRMELLLVFNYFSGWSLKQKCVCRPEEGVDMINHAAKNRLMSDHSRSNVQTKYYVITLKLL